MHADTTRIIALHKADQQREGIASKINALKNEVSEAKKKHQQAINEEEQERALLKKLEERERAHNTRYERYLKKSSDTERLLQTGQASNYAVAQEQLRKCLAIADQEETAILELMEEIEQRHEVIEARSKQTAHRLGLLEKKKAVLAAQLPSLEASLAEAVQIRANQASAVRDDYLLRYEQIRKKLRHAVVTISDEACNSCGMGISSMPLAEHKRGSAVHFCANCGRFLGELI